MPTSSYYFAPVRGESVLSGVARGIDAGVSNLDAGLRERKRQGIEDEDRGRRRLFEDLEIDTMLRDMGGGRGAMPTVREPIGEVDPFMGSLPATPGEDGFLPPGSRSGRTQSAVPVAPMRGLPTADPRYRPVGPAGFGYAMTPEAMEEEEYRRDTGREAAAREGFVARTGPMARAFAAAPRGSPEAATAAVGLASEGVNDLSAFGPQRYEPTTKDEAFALQGQNPDGSPIGGDPAAARVENDSTEAWLLALEQRFRIPGPDNSVDQYMIPYEEIVAMAEAKGAGQDVAIPEPGIDLPWPNRAGVDPAIQENQRARSMARRRPSRLTDDQVRDYREELQRLGREDQWGQILEEENEQASADEMLSDEDIRRILGR